MGIKVELKKGRLGWYVVADFGDGQLPVTKGPMHEGEARKMAAELESVPDEIVVRDVSLEEEKANRRVALIAVGLAGAALVLGLVLVLSLVLR